MVIAWNEKETRRDKHGKDSAQIQSYWEHVKELAARTAGDLRRQEGRTSHHRTDSAAGSGNNFAARTRLELMDVARRLHIAGRNRLTKRELITVIENRQR